MEHNLQILRYDLQLAKEYMDYCEKLNMGDETTASFQVYLDKAKLKLLREVQRVSRLLWPDTGRPYVGEWSVINRENQHRVITSSQEDCIRFIEYSNKFVPSYLKYYIAKWPR